MTLCWTANSDISSRLTISASASGTTVPVSMVFGTTSPVDEADGVENGDEEHGVSGKAVQKCEQATHECLLLRKMRESAD